MTADAAVRYDVTPCPSPLRKQRLDHKALDVGEEEERGGGCPKYMSQNDRRIALIGLKGKQTGVEAFCMKQISVPQPPATGEPGP